MLNSSSEAKSEWDLNLTPNAKLDAILAKKRGVKANEDADSCSEESDEDDDASGFETSEASSSMESSKEESDDEN